VVRQPLRHVGRDRLLSAEVAEALAGHILDGAWPDGQRVPSEPELGLQFGVSRSVVRDAMRTLRTRGLVEVRQGFGTIVRPPSDEPHAAAVLDRLVRSEATIGDVVAARAALDGSVVEAAARNRSDADAGALVELAHEIVRAADAADWAAVEDAHARFHAGLVDACHLPALAIMLRPLLAIVPATGMPAGRDPAHWGAETHPPVAEAVAAEDADAARAAMDAHYAFRHDPAYAELHALPFRAAGAVRQRVRLGR
jgi:GntR family transcriptional regulator, transcriptional repressor for pyruvate dehydrogenase complex